MASAQLHACGELLHGAADSHFKNILANMASAQLHAVGSFCMAPPIHTSKIYRQVTILCFIMNCMQTELAQKKCKKS
jgi:hypothetical protein